MVFLKGCRMNIIKKFSIKEILKFLVGGGSAVLTDFALYHILMLMGAGIDISKLISYITGAAVGFVINKLWTFQSNKFKFSEVYKYILLYIFSAIINSLANRLVLHIFAIQLLAFLVATAVSTVINFLGQKFLVFKKDSNMKSLGEEKF